MLGQGQVDATDLAYQFGFFAQNNKWGPIIATGDQIAPERGHLQRSRCARITWRRTGTR